MPLFLFFLVSILLVNIRAESINDPEIYDGSTQPFVGVQWSAKVREEIYKGKTGTASSGIKFMNFLLYETPISIVPIIGERIGSNFSYGAKKIATKCKELNKTEIWKQIYCISKSINYTLSKYKWPDNSTFCLAHAEAFNETFSLLNIPRSLSSFYTVDSDKYPHMVNRINLTSEDGRPLVYIIDVGWKPDSIFPLTDITEKYHLKNRKDLPKLAHSNKAYSFSQEKKCENGFLKNFKDLKFITDFLLQH